MFEFKILQKASILHFFSLFILVLSIACPGPPHSSSEPHPPERPILVGPTATVVGGSYVYNIVGTDPQGSALVFSTNTPNCTITNSSAGGGVLMFNPAAVGTVTIRVVSENSYGLKSEPGELPVNVTQS